MSCYFGYTVFFKILINFFLVLYSLYGFLVLFPHHSTSLTQAPISWSLPFHAYVFPLFTANLLHVAVWHTWEEAGFQPWWKSRSATRSRQTVHFPIISADTLYMVCLDQSKTQATENCFSQFPLLTTIPWGIIFVLSSNNVPTLWNQKITSCLD